MIEMLAQNDGLFSLLGTGGGVTVVVAYLLKQLKDLKDEVTKLRRRNNKLKNDLQRERNTPRRPRASGDAVRSEDMLRRASIIISETHERLNDIAKGLMTGEATDASKSLRGLLEQFDEHFRVRAVETPKDTTRLLESVRTIVAEIVDQPKEGSGSAERERVRGWVEKAEAVLKEFRELLQRT